jgi:hypothetical protein
VTLAEIFRLLARAGERLPTPDRHASHAGVAADPARVWRGWPSSPCDSRAGRLQLSNRTCHGASQLCAEAGLNLILAPVFRLRILTEHAPITPREGDWLTGGGARSRFCLLRVSASASMIHAATGRCRAAFLLRRRWAGGTVGWGVAGGRSARSSRAKRRLLCR